MARLGVYYSIGFFLIMVVFLGFIIVILKGFNLSTERFSEDSALEKINNIDKSIQESFNDIFDITSGITIRIVGNNLTFIETLPNPNANNFKNNISSLKKFIEGNYSINFTTTDINNNLSLYVKPLGITIIHPNYSDKKVIVTNLQSNFDGYSLTLTTEKNLNSNSCTSSGSSTSPYLNVNAIGSTGTCTKDGITSLTLYDTGNPQILLARISFGGNLLNITAVDNITANLNIINLQQGNQTNIVTTKDGVLYFNFTDFKFTKNGTIRIV